MTCRLCGKPVALHSRYTLQRVIGWERIAGVRASGKHGGSDILMRKRLNEFAHQQCVELERAGINVEQGTLV